MLSNSALALADALSELRSLSSEFTGVETILLIEVESGVVGFDSFEIRN